MDAYPLERGIAQDIFYQEKLKISNNDNITDIIQSKEWIYFYTLYKRKKKHRQFVILNVIQILLEVMYMKLTSENTILCVKWGKVWK